MPILDRGVEAGLLSMSSPNDHPVDSQPRMYSIWLGGLIVGAFCLLAARRFLDKAGQSELTGELMAIAAAGAAISVAIQAAWSRKPADSRARPVSSRLVEGLGFVLFVTLLALQGVAAAMILAALGGAVLGVAAVGAWRSFNQRRVER